MSDYQTLLEQDARDDGYQEGFFAGQNNKEEFIRKRLKLLGYSEGEIKKILGN